MHGKHSSVELQKTTGRSGNSVRHEEDINVALKSFKLHLPQAVVAVRRLAGCQLGAPGAEGKVLRLESLPDRAEPSAAMELGERSSQDIWRQLYHVMGVGTRFNLGLRQNAL
jgi:hypothetical protein